jgi:hypothetical protein
MTETTPGATAIPNGAPRHSPGHDPRTTPSDALLEQAKGVLIFRYSIDADAAHALIQLWAAETGASPDDVCQVIVHEISQGDHAGAHTPQLVRWLENRLRHEFPEVEPPVEHEGETDPSPVRFAVDGSDSPLDAVVVAAREAARRGVPLDLTVTDGPAEQTHAQKAHLMQRIDHALELAREVSPHLAVRLPLETPFDPPADDRRGT